jgi:predicted permease
VSHGFSYQQYTLIRDLNDVLDLAAYAPVRLNIWVDGQLEPTGEGQMVSGNYFSLLGVRPAAGRILGPEDDRVPRGHPVAMISYGYWKRRWGLDPAIVGRHLTLSGVSFAIVGVTPPEFFGVEVGTSPQVFVPIMMQPVVMPVSENLLDNPSLFSSWLRVIARLNAGVPEARANTVLATLAQSEETDWRPSDKFHGGRVNARLELTSAATGLADLRSQFSLPFRILMGVVGVVLLIACANTGNLVLARAAARRPEFALRLALGAGRSRLIRQLLIEGIVLAGLAGVCGVALAYWATGGLVAYVSAGRGAVVLDLAPDARVLAFTLCVSVFSGLIFASAPAIRAARVDMTSVGRSDIGTARHSLGEPQPGRLLVVLQVALSLLLLVGAGLFVRSLQNLNQRRGGVATAQILVVRVEPRGSDQRNAPGAIERLDRTYRDLLARVERIPGVASATLARTSPLSPIEFNSIVKTPSGGERNVPTLMIYPHYFATMGMALSKGRDFDEEDLRPDAPLVAVVNEAFAAELLEGRAPAGVEHGATLSSRGRPAESRPLNIIGVVSDAPYPNLRERTPPMLYQTFRQTRTGRGQMVLHVRVTGDAASVGAQLRNVLQSVDKDVPTFEIRTLAEEVDATLVRERLVATLSTFFGAVALGLVCVGLYGLMSFIVARRTPEIGIRVALGAVRADVAWMIMRQALSLVIVGAAVGLPVAWITARVAAHQMSVILFQLSSTDPLTIAAATGLLILVAMGASWLPARRASRIDPMMVLRND